MREASIRSRKSGEKNISANTVRKVTEVRCLRPIEELLWKAPENIQLTDMGSFRKHCASSRDNLDLPFRRPV
jgi:hypothetical protein